MNLQVIPAEESEEIVDLYNLSGRWERKLVLDARSTGTSAHVPACSSRIRHRGWYLECDRENEQIQPPGHAVISKELTETWEFLSSKQAPGGSLREPEPGQGQYKNAGTETEVNKSDFLCLYTLQK